MKKIILVIVGFVLISSFLFLNVSNSPPAFAISDSMQQACYTGDYVYSNQSGKQIIRDVAEQYKFLVEINNQAIIDVKTDNQNITFENLVRIFNADSTFQKMLGINFCLKSNGFDPNSIETMSNDLAQIVDSSLVPEFGPLAGMIIVISIIGAVVISTRFRSIKQV